jgi:hypothetical protein
MYGTSFGMILGWLSQYNDWLWGEQLDVILKEEGFFSSPPSLDWLLGLPNILPIGY